MIALIKFWRKLKVKYFFFFRVTFDGLTPRIISSLERNPGELPPEKVSCVICALAGDKKRAHNMVSTYFFHEISIRDKQEKGYEGKYTITCFALSDSKNACSWNVALT